MTKTTTNLLLMLITILAGMYFYVTCCSSCGAPVEEEPMKEVVKAPVTSKATSNPITFSNRNYTYNENDTNNFNVSSTSISIPLSQKVNYGIPSLNTFIGINASKVIHLSGYTKSDE